MTLSKFIRILAITTSLFIGNQHLQAQSMTSLERFIAFEKGLKSVDGTIHSIDQEILRHEVNGVAIAIIENGVITHVKGYGHIDRQNSAKVTNTTRFQVASMSKFVAALGIAEAANQGHLSLTKKITSIASQHPGSILDKWIDKKFKNTESNYPQLITLERLLSHSAGLDTHGIGTQMQGFVPSMEKIILGNILDPIYNGVAPIHMPGTKYSYSGGGFTVAEHILELETGKSFADFLTENVLEPAAMNNATYEDASPSTPDLARGCSRGICGYEVMSTKVKAAGGLLATARDYAKLVVLLQNKGLDKNGKRIFSESVIKNILTASHTDTSSKKACTADSQCPTTRMLQITPSISVPVPANETCYLNRCVELIPENSTSPNKTYNGLGVELSSTLLADGYHQIVQHGGSQTGFKTHFRLNRKNKNGIVVYVAGNDEWTKDGKTWGSSKLKSEIVDAFKKFYE